MMMDRCMVAESVKWSSADPTRYIVKTEADGAIPFDM